MNWHRSGNESFKIAVFNPRARWIVHECTKDYDVAQTVGEKQILLYIVRFNDLLLLLLSPFFSSQVPYKSFSERRSCTHLFCFLLSFELLLKSQADFNM